MSEIDEENDSNYIVIPPKLGLKQKASCLGDPDRALSKALARADEAMEELSTNFADWMKVEVDLLITHFEKMKQEGYDSPHTEKFYLTSHDLKGQSSTLGFPIIADVCNNICSIMDNAPEPAAIDMRLFEHHVQVVRAIFNQGPNSQGTQKAIELVEELKKISLVLLKKQFEEMQKKQQEKSETDEKTDSVEETTASSDNAA